MDVATIAEGLNATPGSWPRGAPNPHDAMQGFLHMLQISSDGSEAATANVKAFAEAGGIRAVMNSLEESARDVGRRAKHLDPTKIEMNEDMQVMMLLADLQTIGATLVSNFAAIAMGGESVTLEELKVSKASAMMVKSLTVYPDNPEHVEACLAALMQLLPIDLAGAATAGAPAIIVRTMKEEKVSPWALYLGARALKQFASEGGEVKAQCLAVGGRDALLCACRAPPAGPDVGRQWGVTDVAAKTQVLARGGLAALCDIEGFQGQGVRTGNTLDLNLFVLQDPVVLSTLQSKPEINGCAGVVIGAGEHGVGAQAAGTYKVRIEYPEAKRGEEFELPADQVRLMAP